jgi:hypothetical protein
MGAVHLASFISSFPCCRHFFLLAHPRDAQAHELLAPSTSKHPLPSPFPVPAPTPVNAHLLRRSAGRQISEGSDDETEPVGIAVESDSPLSAFTHERRTVVWHARRGVCPRHSGMWARVRGSAFQTRNLSCPTQTDMAEGFMGSGAIRRWG